MRRLSTIKWHLETFLTVTFTLTSSFDDGKSSFEGQHFRYIEHYKQLLKVFTLRNPDHRQKEFQRLVQLL